MIMPNLILQIMSPNPDPGLTLEVYNLPYIYFFNVKHAFSFTCRR